MGEFNDGSCVAGAGVRELEFFVAEGNGVVKGDDAAIAETEATGEIDSARKATEVVFRLAWRDGEAPVKVGQERNEHLVGLFAGGGVGEPEFAAQTILASAPEAFDASFGLGRVGGDLLDAEFLKGAAALGWQLLTGEFFGDAPVGIVALEDAMAIAVEAEGHAVGGDELTQQLEVADGVLGFELEMGGGDSTGGVVLQSQQGEARPAAFEPVMATSVGQLHQAEAGTALAAGAG